MIKTLARTYHRTPTLAKLLFGAVFLLSLFVTTSKSLYAANNLPFENQLTTIFSSWLDTGNYINTHFKFGGNNFVGIIFWQTGETLSVPEVITIDSGAQSIQCTEKLRGIYYNNQRGRRIRPLDTGNLSFLSGQGSGYEIMTITNGFFTQCTWVSWWYVPLLNEVYGQIDHSIWTQTGFRMIAWIQYDFTGNTFSGLTFGHTLSLTTWWEYSWFIFDTNGGIAELNINIPRCQDFTSLPSDQPIIIPQGSGMTFTCYGNNVTGYILGILYSWDTVPFYTGMVLTTGISYARSTWSTLATGDYIATCTVLWPNGIWPQCGTQIPFHVWISWTVIVPPTVGIWYISVWLTGINGSTLYYKWDVTVAATVYDVDWLSGNTCEYTIDWTTRNVAGYHTTYCDVNVSSWPNLSLQFRIKNIHNEMGTWGIQTYLYDATSPVTIDNSNSNWTTGSQTITLTPIDTWVWARNTYYCVYNSWATACTPTTTWTSVVVSCLSGDVCQQYIRYYSDDKLWNIETIRISALIRIDSQIPTAPSLLTLSGTNVCPSIPLTVTRSGSIDSWSQLAYYRYEIYSNSGMVTGMVLSGTATNTSTWVTINTSLLPLGTQYMRVQAVDTVGMIATSNTINFTLGTQYCPVWNTGVVIVTPTIRLRNVDLDTVYRSDPILILGLTWSTPIRISRWMLFINNSTGLWTTGIITANDTIYIEMVSSDVHDTTVSSNIYILGLTWTFSITTKKIDCVLSAAEKIVIQNLYANLKAEYNNDLSKLADFLNTFQSMVQDESALTNSCNLDYLLALIEDDLGFEWGIDTRNHITPNCKEYSIEYDVTERAYYAPEMMNRYYFINRESIIRHLDYYNPGDCHVNTYATNSRTPDTSDPMTHIAPNGKIYHFIGQYGGFSASEFPRPKYFDSLGSIVRYIDSRNPPKDIWKHIIDISFTPIVYAAPNGKEYRIYKTDRWYMSYKLMNVRYYPTLSALKNYIDTNNPSAR